MAHDFGAQDRRARRILFWVFGIPIPVLLVLLYFMHGWA